MKTDGLKAFTEHAKSWQLMWPCQYL